jgi:4-amino-4-deoxy-L-arabinose transferase-like glycosyltransferase
VTPTSPAEPEVDSASDPREAKRSGLRSFAPLGAILVLALALRLWGITWGLPNQDRYFSYHPDEGVNVLQGLIERDTQSLRPHLDLQFYNYGGLYFYLWQGAAAANRAYGVVSLPSTDQPETPSPESFAALILIGRLITVAFGTLTAWTIFALGLRLFGRTAGLLAAFMWAITPVAVVHGHYATVDIAATFFVTLALVFAARAMTVEPGALARKSMLLAGFCSGLAAATKYNTGLVLVAAVAAVLLRGRSGQPPAPKWMAFAVVGLAVIGFFVGCPGVLVNPSKFWQDFTYELTKSQQGMGLLFAETGNGWLYHLNSSLRLGLGLPLMALSIVAAGRAVLRRTPQEMLLLSFLLVYYFIIGLAQVRFLRYILPITPVLVLLASSILADPPKPQRWVRVELLGTAILAFTLLLTLALDRMFVLPDSRDQAKTFIEELPAGSSVAFVWTPWYHSPPLMPDFTQPNPKRRWLDAQSYAKKRLLLPAFGSEWDANLLKAPLPDAFAVSEFETGDVQRLKSGYAQPFFDLWRERYTPHVFDKYPSIFGIDFGKPDYTPNDWLYPNPRTTVYTLKPPTVILSNEPRDRGLPQPPGR